MPTAKRHRPSKRKQTPKKQTRFAKPGSPAIAHSIFQKNSRDRREAAEE